MTATAWPHIQIDADGVPMIQGTRTKVVEIVLDHLAHDWDAREIHRQHPHLGLGAIHSALAYYYDHQSEIDPDIQRRLERTTQIRAELGPSNVRMKLKQLGHLS
ncbi:MAG: DUF433 domain-containing protein [Planctomycetes bacterium]|nr:DUF433 domain-containing protein [Planctomycetota bacterium]